MSKRISCFVVVIVGVSLLCAGLVNGQTARSLRLIQAQPAHVQEAIARNVQETIDNILREFYERHSLPGGISMAISYRERLVYVGAIGYADRERTIPLTPEHRMRIASLSKPITAIAIMKLWEERRLNLNDDVFGGIFRGEYGIPEFENRPVRITVRQLLEHTAGGWGHTTNDPMRLTATITGEELMRTVIRERSLENLPGTTYGYSNFGYWVLGRVIERVSGMTYEDYVKTHILMPSGISGMRIGEEDASAPDEAEYIGNPNENPFARHRSPRNQDANGGWIANPTELVKLLVRVDGFANVPDILRSTTIRTMTTPSAQRPTYALGWFVNRNGHWWHAGSRPGVRARMERNPDGFNWAVLINSSPGSDGFSFGDMERLFGTIRSAIQVWPAGTEL